MRSLVASRCVLYTVSLAVILSTVFSFAASLDETDRLQFADGLYTRKMYELAGKEYKSFISAFPKSEQMDVVLFRTGECHRQLGDLGSAEKSFKKVFVNYPNSKLRLKAGFRRADVFMQDKRYEAAIELFNLVLKENPSADIASACIFFSGDALLAMGKIPEATRSFEKVRETYRDSQFCSYSLLKLGEIYGKSENAKDKQKALDMYKQAADKPLSPRVGAEALFQVAEYYSRKKEYSKSAEAYKSLLMKYPSDQRSSEAALQAAWAAHNAGLYTDALRIATDRLKTLSEKNKKDQVDTLKEKPEWLYLKANCERQLMNNDSAVQTYATLLKDYPDNTFSGPARYETAVTYYKMGKFNEAIMEALKIKLPGDIKKDVYWLLAESYSSLKKEGEAIQYYRLIVREFPKSDVSGDATYRLAHHLQNRGEFKEASRYYNQIALDHPQNMLAPRALFASAYCLSKEKMDEEAVRDWSALVRKYPRDSLVEESLYQKAMGETRLKRSNDAMASLRALVKQFPKSKFLADAHYWNGRHLGEADKAQDAEDEFREALNHSPRKELEREIKYHLAAVLHQRGVFEESSEIFQLLLASPASEKCSPGLLEWLSTYQFEKKKYDLAVSAARAIVKQNSDPAWQQTGWCLVARGLREKGDKDEAQKAYVAALLAKASTKYAAEAALRLGEFNLADGENSDAGKCFRQAASLASDQTQMGTRVRAYVGLARSAKAELDFDSAAKYFMTVAVLYDDAELVPESLYEASLAFGKLGKGEESRKAIKELNDRYPKSAWAQKAGSDKK